MVVLDQLENNKMKRKLLDQVRIIINRYLSGDLKLSIIENYPGISIRNKEDDITIFILERQITICYRHFVKLDLNQEETNEFKYFSDKIKEVSEKELLSFLQDFNNSSSEQTIF